MLSGKQRSYLRSQANKLDPIIHIGKDGITQAVIDQVDEALNDHELIKGRVLNNSLVDARSAADRLAEMCKCDIVQVIGNVFVIYKRNEEESIFNLP